MSENKMSFEEWLWYSEEDLDIEATMKGLNVKSDWNELEFYEERYQRYLSTPIFPCPFDEEIPF